MSFTRTAGYRLATLIKPRVAAMAGVSAPRTAADVAMLPRGEIVDASAKVASHDGEFLALVAAGDRHRDAREWWLAEQAYGAALARYPYQAGYWVQQGHMRKEQGRFGEAEISYRTGAALGVAPEGVIEHLRFVMNRQGVPEDRYPPRFKQEGGAANQAPGEPDVLLLARLLWRVEALSNDDMLALLRENATCDALFAAMVADLRFEHANLNWLTQMHDGDL